MNCYYIATRPGVIHEESIDSVDVSVDTEAGESRSLGVDRYDAGLSFIKGVCVYCTRIFGHAQMLKRCRPQIPARAKATQIMASGARGERREDINNLLSFISLLQLFRTFLSTCRCTGNHIPNALLQAESQLDCCFPSSPYQHRLLPLTRYVNKSPTPYSHHISHNRIPKILQARNTLS
jgi:hypothetical protein